jgi:hypothetical protein
MTRLFCLSALAVGLFIAATPRSNADAQSLTIGRGGVQYNSYGRGYYGGYGRGYRRYGPEYAPRTRTYSGYGNGPYGYGSERDYQTPSQGGYRYRDGTYYNGRGPSGYYVQPYAPVYRPYGFGVYIQ